MPTENEPGMPTKEQLVEWAALHESTARSLRGAHGMDFSSEAASHESRAAFLRSESLQRALALAAFIDTHAKCNGDAICHLGNGDECSFVDRIRAKLETKES